VGSRRLRAIEGDASSSTSRDASHGPTGRRVCGWCAGLIPSSRRADAKFCGVVCRQASWRFGVRRSLVEATDRPMHFAYADPPYPGKAAYYPERQEVDHASLLQRLTDSYADGWALSTSAESLRDVLALIPASVPVRVCAWTRSARRCRSLRPLSAWEPLIVAGGRPLPAVAVDGRPIVQVIEDALVYKGRYRAFPGALVGMKPPQFAEWMFAQLGAAPGDQLDDLYPGSGAVAEAWWRYVGPAIVEEAGSA
jgi:hypothetical protein